MNHADGLHILAHLEECEEVAHLLDYEGVSHFLVECIKYNGLTPLRSDFYSFGAGKGYTGFVILGESHVSIHTWPEFARASIDIYVCNVTADNSKKAECIFDEIREFFGNKSVSKYYKIER